MEIEDRKNNILGYRENKRWGINLKCKKRLRGHEEITCKKIIGGSNNILLKDIGT
jgi:hypothetical protein